MSTDQRWYVIACSRNPGDPRYGAALEAAFEAGIAVRPAPTSPSECEHDFGWCSHDRNESGCSTCGQVMPFPDCGMTDEEIATKAASLGLVYEYAK